MKAVNNLFAKDVVFFIKGQKEKYLQYSRFIPNRKRKISPKISQTSTK